MASGPFFRAANAKARDDTNKDHAPGCLGAGESRLSVFYLFDQLVPAHFVEITIHTYLLNDGEPL